MFDILLSPRVKTRGGRRFHTTASNKKKRMLRLKQLNVDDKPDSVDRPFELHIDQTL
jgi:hypothetical protein